MTNTQVFNINTDGNYPNERYLATPITFTQQTLPTDFTSIFWNQLDGSGVAIQTGGSLITRDYLRYHKNPLNQVLDFSDFSYKSVINYNNVTYQRQSTKFVVSLTGPLVENTRFIENVPTITLNNSLNNYSSLNFTISSLRKYIKSPYEFYFFYIQLNDITKNSYGYMIYPNRIFLKPKSINYVGNKWQLTTNVKILNSDIVHIQSTNIEKDAVDLHVNRLNTPPTNISDLPSTILNNKLNFSLYGNRTKCFDTKISTNSLTLAPTFCSLNLEDSDLAYIDADSTFISYSAIFTDNNNVIQTLSQNDKSVSYFYNIQKFNPTFILQYNPSSNEQTFQLLQAPLNPNLNLSDISNCVLQADFNLKTGSFNFYNQYAPAKIKFNNKYPLKVDYIANCYNLKTVNLRASSTLTNQSLIIDDGVNTFNHNILNPISVNSVNTYDIVWETTYPPYCYSYKVDLKDDTNSVYLDSNGLNFYLKLSAIKQTSNSVTLSAFIASDFNSVNMPILPTDSIKFEIVADSNEDNDAFLNGITCYYGDELNLIPYDIKSSPLVIVSEKQSLVITNSNSNFTGASFTIKGTIYTASGQMDSFNNLNVSLGYPDFGIGNRLSLNVLDEKSNEITLDSSFNVTSLDWPYKDLRDSNIVWFYGGNNSGLSLNYVDDEGNYLAPVNGPVLFSDKTWKVNLSGYGPNLTTISLSSQKYNEVATITTNPRFYDFLSQGKIKVGPITKLNNLELTRNITLTAAIPYGNKLFSLPPSIPINWTWEYDDTVEPTLQPIEAIQTLNQNQNYVYGINMKSTLCSAIKINVTPGFSKTSPKVHRVKIIANIDVVQPTITGSYTFNVDDFPDPSIFNCDFDSYFTNFSDNPDYIIASTRLNQNTITRSEISSLNFTFSADENVLKNIKNSNLRWFFNSVKNSLNSTSYNINLKDPLSGLPQTTLNGITVTALNVGLTINSGIAPGWTSAHNVSAVTNIFILSSINFFNPLKFIIYPEYAWIGDSDLDYRYLTLLKSNPNSEDYFTKCYMPSSYNNKKSNSQTYWMSANNTWFDEYIYQNKQNYFLTSTTSAHSLLEIGYNPYDFRILAGLPISLIAYNNTFYPENIKIDYLDEYLNVDTGTTYLTSLKFNIEAKTTRKMPTTSVYDNFFMSPVIKEYNNISLTYSPLCNDILQDRFNIQDGGKISVIQYINTIPEKSPAEVIDGTVTYCLSSHYWQVSATVPSSPIGLSSTYNNLFELKQGDPSIPLYVCDLGEDELYFYANHNLIQQIPETTFDKYIGTNEYPKNPNLWDKINI
jgi:hypothetical protein